jgi:hypothetical protein
MRKFILNKESILRNLGTENIDGNNFPLQFTTCTAVPAVALLVVNYYATESTFGTSLFIIHLNQSNLPNL